MSRTSLTRFNSLELVTFLLPPLILLVTAVPPSICVSTPDLDVYDVLDPLRGKESTSRPLERKRLEITLDFPSAQPPRFRTSPTSVILVRPLRFFPLPILSTPIGHLPLYTLPLPSLERSCSSRYRVNNHPPRSTCPPRLHATPSSRIPSNSLPLLLRRTRTSTGPIISSREV
jgi:hypothetical protein